MEKIVFKRTKVLIIICILTCVLAISCLIPLIGNGIVQAEAADDSQELTLNEKTSVTITKTEVKKFHIRLDDSAYYIVETRGSLATVLQVKINGKLVGNDLSSGVDLNACVGFVGANTEVTIELRNVYIWQTGTTEIQIRKQQAVLYGFEYTNNDKGNLNTIPDLDKPYQYLNGKYQTYKFTSSTIQPGHFLENDNRGYQRINSEIFFYSGHTYAMYEGDKADGLNIPSGDISLNFFNNMENCKLAVWSTCYSSNSENMYNLSIAQKSINAGARAAIGWPDTIQASSSKVFTDRLFEKLSQGATIEDACNYAKNGIIWIWDSVRDYQILGDSSATIAVNDFDKKNSTATTNLTSSQSISANILSKVVQTSDNWIGINIENNIYRYYKTINGIPTNEYYDVEVNSNNDILNVKQSSNRLNYDTILPIKYKADVNALHNIDSNYKLTNTEKHIIYYIKDNIATPIELQYNTYQNGDIVYMDVVCINLNDGTYIDYEDVCA